MATTELAQRENGVRREIAPARKGLELTTLDEMLRFGEMVIKGGIGGKDDKPETIMVKVQYGLEIGLSPMQAIQNVMVVDNKPQIWGDAALALCMSSSLFDHKAFSETWIKEGDGMSAVCTVRRLPDGNPVTRKWSETMTETAGLKGKDNHKKYPARMRQMRARAWALKDAFPDILKGIEIREYYHDVVDVEIERDGEPAKTKSGMTLPGSGRKSRKIVTVTEPAAEPEEPIQTAEPVDMIATCFNRFYARADAVGMDGNELRAVIEALGCDVDEIETEIKKRELATAEVK